MSAAFDTVNHEILLSRLEYRFGMAGSVLAWIRSHLTDWSQCVYHKVVLPAEPASLVAYLESMIGAGTYVVICVHMQLLSVIYSRDTISDSI